MINFVEYIVLRGDSITNLLKEMLNIPIRDGIQRNINISRNQITITTELLNENDLCPFRCYCFQNLKYASGLGLGNTSKPDRRLKFFETTSFKAVIFRNEKKRN